MTQRFLTINVFALLNRGVGDGKMHVIRHGDIHRINLVSLLSQQLAPIRVTPRAGHGLLRLREMIGVHIAKRHDLQARMLQESVQVIPSHPAHADAGMIEFAIGRRTAQSGRQYERRRHTGQRRRLQKLTTRESGLRSAGFHREY